MYSAPCARFTRFMMPSTSVSPAAMRNSMTPSWTPFSSCSKTRLSGIKKGRVAPRFYRSEERPSLHLAFLVVGVLVLLERLLLDLHLGAVLAALYRLEQVEILDRVMVDVELERPADGVVVRLLHGLHHAVRVLEVALDRLHRGVDEQDRVVALRAIVGGRVAELLAEVGDVFLARRYLQVRAPEARLVLADRRLFQRRQRRLVDGEHRVERDLVAQPGLHVLAHEL